MLDVILTPPMVAPQAGVLRDYTLPVGCLERGGVALTIGTIGNSLCPVGRELWVGGAGGRGVMNPHQGGQRTAALAMAQAGESIKRRLP